MVKLIYDKEYDGITIFSDGLYIIYDEIKKKNDRKELYSENRYMGNVYGDIKISVNLYLKELGKVSKYQDNISINNLLKGRC